MPSLKRRMEKSRVSFMSVIYVYPVCPFLLAVALGLLSLSLSLSLFLFLK